MLFFLFLHQILKPKFFVMYKTDKFNVQISKHEYQRISKIVDKLAMLSDLQEVQELYYIWTNFSCREMYGFSKLNPNKVYKDVKERRKIRFENEKSK